MTVRVPATITIPGSLTWLGRDTVPLTGFCVGPANELFFDGKEVGQIVGSKNIRINSEHYTDYSHSPPKETATIQSTEIDCILYFEALYDSIRV